MCGVVAFRGVRVPVGHAGWEGAVLAGVRAADGVPVVPGVAAVDSSGDGDCSGWKRVGICFVPVPRLDSNNEYRA